MYVAQRYLSNRISVSIDEFDDLFSDIASESM
jgi:Mn-containing catalase